MARMEPPPAVTFACMSLLAASTAVAGDAEFFAARVEPLLRERCFECHSHAAGKMKGGLTLDSRSGWEKGGDSGPALVPGKPEESLLVKMVRWADEDHRMPPRQQLAAEETTVLEQWVREGAVDPRQAPAAKGKDDDWWSLRPLVRPEPPAPGHPIDAFVSASLSARGLTPSPEADRRTLIRRVSFDLHGLPPSPEAVDSFVKSGDPHAWETLVDSLLASPRLGERWARHWMDAIHFADSHGFEHDVFRPNAWRFRDWLIGALNDDTPWDRFIRAQLAADVFFPDDSPQTAALGFLGAGTLDLSAAGTAPMSFEYLDRDDLVTQTMAAFASTTANCARCHAHKFDPITQEDYFSLQAVFAGIAKGDVPYDADAATTRERQRLLALKDAAARRDAAVLASAESATVVATFQKSRAPAEAWHVLVPETFTSNEGTTLERLDDGSVLSSGARPDKDTFTLTANATVESATALRVELLPHDSLPVRGPGRQDNGNLHLSEVVVHAFRPGAAKPERILLQKATSDFDQDGYGVAKALDGDPTTSWAIHPQEGAAHEGVFVFPGPVALPAGTKVTVALQQYQGGGHLIGRCRLSLTGADPAAAAALPGEISAILAAKERTPEQQTTLAAFAVARDAEGKLAALPPPAHVWAAARTVLKDGKPSTIDVPRPIRVLKRGELDKPGEEAGPGALSAVTALPARFNLPADAPESARRAALAEWLADPRQPLAWRSIVNRVWHHHFSRGLCDTPSDFGRMGGVPTHPELLDWLACWFRDEAKGSLKALHRLIVTSETYRQSSTTRDDAAALDADNRLLWRMNRPRLDADEIRDAVLAASGRLDLTMGGPGVQHFKSSPGPQSTPALDYTAFDWASPAGARRSIYRVVWRGIADPFMEAVDFPDMGLLQPTRGFSASALQALTLFNNDFVLHHSTVTAQRAETVPALFRMVLQRDPTPQETADFGALVEKRGLAAAARVLLNSNEFLFLD